MQSIAGTVAPANGRLARAPARPQPVRKPAASVVARSYQQGPHPQRRDGSGFWTGFALGGAIFGAAGFFFAPQISRAILNEQQKFKAPQWLEQEQKPVSKEELEDKIDQLHKAINDVATQIGPDSTNNSTLKEKVLPKQARARLSRLPLGLPGTTGVLCRQSSDCSTTCIVSGANVCSGLWLLSFSASCLIWCRDLSKRQNFLYLASMSHGAASDL
eukprot:TRINITY_DN3625_c1_g4_i1.p1 TRINITY_DN3625_c1_g4~~TRINITY_DN3625_c1_g4_i1.p1  ORF type:complete len:216 (-),score=8.50 TRINITY_DN3625_c1_g4_i1:51-698(-)